MLEKVFDIEKFNIFSDEDNYYFFRALEELDIEGIKNKTITNQYGRVNRLITDREFYGEEKYSIDSEISLEEMVDHIKMHYNKHTNCISFSSNTNVGLSYGRGDYQDSYIVLRVPKKEMGKTTYEAGLYMLKEIQKKINKIIDDKELSNNQINQLNQLNEITTQEELDLFIKDNIVINNQLRNIDIFRRGIDFVDRLGFTKSKKYNALDEEQNFYKNKIITMIDLLEDKNIIPNMSNRFLIQTVGNAFSSLEIIHYKDIDDIYLQQIDKEFMDVLSLVQQVPGNTPNMDKLKQELIDFINGNQIALDEFKYDGYYIDDENDYSIERMYQLTNGDIDYDSAINTYKNMFYLTKSRLRAYKASNWLKKITDNNPDYDEIYKYIEKYGYGIEEDITTRLSETGKQVSESVSLAIRENEKELMDMINSYSEVVLEDIINDPLTSLKLHLRELSYIEDNNVNKEVYYARAIVDLFDFKKELNIDKIYDEQKKEIIDKLKELDVVKYYEKLKKLNLKEADIAKVLLTTIIKGKSIEEIDTKESFTINELENFLGYYKVKGQELKLRDYQARAVENIDKIFEDKNFATAVLPTGAGKSFIALAEMLKHKDEEILYLAPNKEILNQLARYAKEYVHGTINTTGKSKEEIIHGVFPNLTLTTYQELQEESAKEIRNKKYKLIVFDEIHRTGAQEWNKYIKDTIDNQDANVKVLGVSATPQRDTDFKDMSDIWAEYLGYSEDEVLRKKHLAVNMDVFDAIDFGYVTNPKVVICEYNFIKQSQESINNILNENERRKFLDEFEKLRRSIDQSNGIEKILKENLKEDGKYIVFLPVSKNNDGIYEDEDGNQIGKKKAERIIQIYQNQMMQYVYAGNYIEENIDKFKKIEECIKEKQDFSDELISWIEEEKDNILLLSKMKSINNNLLITRSNEIVEEIINRMGFAKLPEKKQGKLLREKTKKLIECYSMLGSYGQKKNDKELENFNNSKSKKQKFMFVMNKLNEGVHVDGINGIIWLRPMDKNSKILYLQQLGRCIHGILPNMKEVDIPVVVDLVNNTLIVNLAKGLMPELKDLEFLKHINDHIEKHGYIELDIHSEDKKEQKHARQLKRIRNKYKLYLDDKQLEKLDYKRKIAVTAILNEGYFMDLWNTEFEETEISNISQNPKEETHQLLLLESFGIIGVVKELYELKNKSESYDLRSFETMYSYLVRLQEQGEKTNLRSTDKLKINEDGTLSIIKKKYKYVNGKQILFNQDEYFTENLINIGNWLYENREKLDESQIKRLEEIGYFEKEDRFEEMYSYLVRLQEQGEKTNIKQADKIKIEEDGSLKIIKPKYKNIGDKRVIVNLDEYNEEGLINLGSNLYQYEKEESQMKKLEEIGYFEKEDRFEEMYSYLVRLQQQGEKTNIKQTDKIKIYDDAKIEVVSLVRKRDGKKNVIVNEKEYNDSSLMNIGDWFYKNIKKGKLDESQIKRLEKIGYFEKEDKFEEMYSYLVRLQEQGEQTTLKSADKIKIKEDGSLKIVKKIMKRTGEGNKKILSNPEEYNDAGLINLGRFFDYNYKKKSFSASQLERLKEIGYFGKIEEQLDYVLGIKEAKEYNEGKLEEALLKMPPNDLITKVEDTSKKVEDVSKKR